MKNFIEKIKVLNPLFVIKLVEVNVLIRRLHHAGEIHVLSIDYSTDTPVLMVRVDDAEIIYKSGIERGIIKSFNGWEAHETQFGNVKLCWIVCPWWEAILSNKERRAIL